MIDIDKRISEKMGWWSPDGTDWHPERTAEVKQLIRDVLEAVKPQRIQVEPNTDVLRAYQNGANDVVGEMETNIKDLGL